MAGAVDQAKMKFSKIVNSRSYTRFNQNPDGENSRVEVNLSVDTEEEEMDGAEQGHVQPETYMRPTIHPGSWNKWRIFVVVAVLLVIFCLGSLIGYSFQPKPKTASCVPIVTKEQTSAPQVYEAPESTMDWSDVVNLLNNQLSPKKLEDMISEYSGAGMAGSSEDNILADKIHDFFKTLNMDPWIDEHFVKLQYPVNKTNKVFFDSKEIWSPKGFLAYSKTGSQQGRVVYANYGELQDLEIVNANKVNLNGSVVLMRAGKISMAQKVANVASKGAIAALIYPDPADYDNMNRDTELYGHVHLGSGDPYTPGFPSFNHGQFSPVNSSGLPDILAQTITATMAQKIFDKMGGKSVPSTFEGAFSNYKFGSETDLPITVEVNNELVDTRIHNVFGVIKGFVDADRYVVIGAQRDSMSSGYAKSSVGTGLLLELARVFSEMKKGGFRPKRSIVFASWTAGDYGNVGLTEWLEGYVTSLDKKAFTYISLDGFVTGVGSFKASASPLLQTLLEKTSKKLKDPVNTGSSLFQTLVVKPMEMENGAYPFLAFSGIPSVTFRFTSTGDSSVDYKYFGTALDDENHLKSMIGQKLGEVFMAAAQVAGQMALRLVHDHILKLDVTKYVEEIGKRVNAIVDCTNDLKRKKVDKSDSLSTQWLMSAKGSYSRAAYSLQNYIRNSDLEDMEMSRIINNRIMKVEHNLISPYVSLRDVPFRHVFFGNGWQTASDLETYLKSVSKGEATLDMDQVLNQFALLTWTIQGCANDLAGEIWSLDNEI
ncbi:transferrin receptor 1b isoform X1 [Misgurnus anguillicaudatus]|uniref:transferrin receptor 1b isoform X1 n=2 Tax=Misgurnus anguillicaudatus TaxID=75329 RepID=UPI003CCF032F